MNPATVTQRAASSATQRPQVRLGPGGMDEECAAALARLEQLAGEGRVGVAGVFAPDATVRARLQRLGVEESVEEADFPRFDRLVIPRTGLPPKRRKAWEGAGGRWEDLSASHVRRAQAALGLLRLEGAVPLVIGAHDDAETEAIAGAAHGAIILEETTDTARLHFAPSFGAVSQTRLSPRRVSWLVQQLRLRHRDAKVTYLDTLAPAMKARERALEPFLGWCDCMVVVGEAEETSVRALLEAANRAGRATLITASARDLDLSRLAGARRVAVTGGSFVPQEEIRAVAETIARREGW